MVRNKKGQVTHTFSRRERGTPISVESHKIQMPDGAAGLAYGINMAAAEVPDRVYFGGTCGVYYSPPLLKIMFAQPKLGNTGLRSMLLLSMTPLGVEQFLRSVDELKEPSLDDIARTVRIEPEALTEVPNEEPEQTAEFAANIIASAFSGLDSCLDFYNANAFSMLSLRMQNKLYLEPIVRVNTRTSLVLSLVRRLREVQTEFGESSNGVWRDRGVAL